MTKKKANPLDEWRLYFQYDPDLDLWRGLSTLVELKEKLEAAFNFLQTLAEGNKADRQFGVDAAELAFRCVDQVFRHLGVEYEPLEHRPHNLSGAKQALGNLVVDVREKVIVRQMAVGDSDVDDRGPDPSKKRPRRDEIPDDYEANILIKKYLDGHPRATIREVAEAVGLSTGKVSQLDAWRRAMAEKKASKPTPKKAERPLTDKMLAARGQKDDTADKLMQDEAIWQWLLENSRPKEKAELFMKKSKEKAELIDLARERYEKEHPNADD